MQDDKLNPNAPFTRSSSMTGAADQFSSQPVVGSFIAEKYKVLELLGRGGMGSVYKVEQVYLHKTLALKTLDAAQVGNQALRRFQTEAKAASMLEHPNLVKVLDFGIVNESQPYLVMDYFAGVTLKQRIVDFGPMPVPEAIEIFIQAAEGLAYAHEKGVVHRDVKPSNIMLLRQREPEFLVKILDFGLAKLIYDNSEDAPTLTRTGDIFGTPQYMSPEQCLGVAIDQRTDLYSLGCVMFETLTATPPFMGDSPLSMMMKHQTESPQSLKEATLGREFSVAVEYMVAKLLAKDPRMRYQNAQALLHDLRRIKAGQSIDPAHRSTASDKGSNWQVAAIKLAIFGFMSLCLLVAAFWMGRSSAPTETRTVQLRSGTEDGNLQSVDQLLSDKHLKLPQYLSAVLPDDTRIFNFTKAEGDLGSLRDFDPETKVFNEQGTELHGRVAAKGTIIIQHFHPFLYYPGLVTLDQAPDVLAHFRPDEIRGIDLTNNCDADDKTMFSAKNYKNVNVLILFGLNKVTPKGLQVADHWPLTTLDADGAKGFLAADIAQFDSLPQLERLRIKAFKNINPVLRKMKNSTALKYLRVRMDDPDEECMQLIATMPNLQLLDLSSNKLEPGSIKYLKSLKNLRELCLQDTHSRCADVIDLANNLPKLRTLEVSVDTWRPEEIARLKAALPLCRLYKEYDNISGDEVPGNCIQNPRPNEPPDDGV
ncbi:MAG TPA: protein kinase [Planktothrix sp.]|jgi:serine/threonine protein kinase